MRPYPEEDAPTLIDRALGESFGQTCLANARERVLNDLQRNRFRSVRAVEIYVSSIDDAVWVYLGESPLRRIVYRNHLRSLERSEKGSQLADAFAQESGAIDRPPQGWFRAAS